MKFINTWGGLFRSGVADLGRIGEELVPDQTCRGLRKINQHRINAIKTGAGHQPGIDLGACGASQSS